MTTKEEFQAAGTKIIHDAMPHVMREVAAALADPSINTVKQVTSVSKFVVDFFISGRAGEGDGEAGVRTLMDLFGEAGAIRVALLMDQVGQKLLKLSEDAEAEGVAPE